MFAKLSWKLLTDSLKGFSHKHIKLYCSFGRRIGFAWSLDTPACDQAPCIAALLASPLCNLLANLVMKLLTRKQTS